MTLDTQTEKIQEARKTLYLKANPEDIDPEVDHQELPKEDAVVKPVVGLRKWHRGQNPAAWLHREPKELTQGDGGVNIDEVLIGNRIF